jgi:hypothetical protein
MLTEDREHTERIDAALDAAARARPGADAARAPHGGSAPAPAAAERPPAAPAPAQAPQQPGAAAAGGAEPSGGLWWENDPRLARRYRRGDKREG